MHRILRMGWLVLPSYLDKSSNTVQFQVTDIFSPFWLCLLLTFLFSLLLPTGAISVADLKRTLCKMNEYGQQPVKDYYIQMVAIHLADTPILPAQETLSLNEVGITNGSRLSLVSYPIYAVCDMRIDDFLFHW